MSKKSNMPVFGNASVAPDTSLELKGILELAQTAAWLSGQNMEVIGDPGSGKTSILHFMAKQVFGFFEENGHYLKIECTPSTRESRVIGHENPMYVLDPEAKKKGIEYWINERTPRDENVWHVLLNERSRLNDMAADALLPVMDVELNTFHPVTFSADSNWLPSNPRQQALGDRFTVRVWYVNSIVDPHGIRKHGKPKNWKYNVPDAKTIFEVRDLLEDFWKSGQDSNADRAVMEAIDTLLSGLPGTQFVTNNRRISQWISVLYTMGVFYTGEANFSELPSEAYKALAYCYPTMTPVEALEWRKLVMASVDPLDTRISEFEAQAMKQWKDTYAEIQKMRNPQERQQAVTQQIGALLAGYQKELQSQFNNDPRAVSAIHRLTVVYKKMYRGEPIE